MLLFRYQSWLEFGIKEYKQHMNWLRMASANPYQGFHITCLLETLSKFNTQHIWEFILLLLLLSRFSRVQLCATPKTAATRLPCPWDSPGKNTGVGCHFLLQCMKVKSESEVAESCLTLSDPMDCSLPGSSVHGIFQARVLEWCAIAFSGEFILLYQNSMIHMYKNKIMLV